MNFEIVDRLVDPSYDPQPLLVEEESLGIEKTLNKKPAVVRSGRVAYLGDYADVGEKVSGEVTYEVRAETLLKPLYAHFQCGTVSSISPYTYKLYPLKTPIREFYSGAYTTGTYGATPQKAYQVMVGKKTSDQGFFLLRNGIVDKVSFELVAEEPARARCSFLFTEYDLSQVYLKEPGDSFGATYEVVDGTYVGLPHPFNISILPIGTYATTSSFNFDRTDVFVDGTAYPLTGFSFTSSNNAQEIKKAGKKNPNRYIFGNHSTTGRMVLDMPDEVVHLVGSMLDKKPFSVVGTMGNVDGEQVIFRMPVCQRLPFVPILDGRTFYPSLTINFEAMATEALPSIEVEIRTNYAFIPLTGHDTLLEQTESMDTLVDTTSSNNTLKDIV